MQVCAHFVPYDTLRKPRHLTQGRPERQSAERCIDSSDALCYPTAANWFLLPVDNHKATDIRMLGTTLTRFLFLGAVACFAVLLLYPTIGSAKPKSNRAPRPEPELKVLELKISPNPYTTSDGSVEFSTLVQLPKDLNGATILEVSSLVSSPSKTSIRFLSIRKPLESPSHPQDSGEQARVSIVLTWDGMDHNKTPAEAGLYHYELRAKLLSNGEKGPRTQMVSWPKRGTLEIR